MTKHIALFGGTFDPPHEDHARILRWLMRGQPREFDAIFLTIVRDTHAHDKKMTPFLRRLEMLRRMRQQTCGIHPVGSMPLIVDQTEKYTVDFLARLHQEYPDTVFHLVVGSDILEDTSRWERWDNVCDFAQLLPIVRKGVPATSDCKWHKVRSRGFSSTQIRKQLAARDLTHIIGEGGMLMETVFSYIEQEGIYGFLTGIPERRVTVEEVTLSLAEVDRFVEAGGIFNLKLPVVQVLGVSWDTIQFGLPGIKFRYVSDTDRYGELYPQELCWVRKQTVAWVKGEEFTDPKPVPMSNGIFGIKKGTPAEGYYPSKHIGQLGDYDFFEVIPGLLGIFG